MKTLNFCERNLFDISVNNFASFKISNDKMNSIRGGEDPIKTTEKDFDLWLPDQP